MARALSSLHYILANVDIEAAERILGAWMGDQLDTIRAVAIDGKTLRGSYNRDLGGDGKPRAEPPWQQLSVVDIATRTVVAQVGFSGKKEEAEGAALRKQLEQLQPGTLVLADALHTSQQIGRKIEELGLHYILSIQENQPSIFETLQEYTWPCTQSVEEDCGHGRIERRSIAVTDRIDRDIAKPWVDYPGALFAARITREVVFKKTGQKRKTESAYYITNLSPELATPETLQELVRRYWGAVENGIHLVRDTALGEDACPVRTKALLRIMAVMANLAISILRLLEVENIHGWMEERLLAGGAEGVLQILLV